PPRSRPLRCALSLHDALPISSPMLAVGRLFRVTDALDRRLRPPFATAGLGNGDFDVLAALRRSGDPYALTPGELSRTILVTTGADRKSTRLNSSHVKISYAVF